MAKKKKKMNVKRLKTGCESHTMKTWLSSVFD